MERDEIADGEAMSAVEGGPAISVEELDQAFENFREALLTAHKRGSITAMRAAVESFDRFEAMTRTP
jgi:hypothetical protein